MIEEDDLPVVVQLFSHSYFILPTMLPTWLAAVEAFRMKRFVHTLTSLIPRPRPLVVPIATESWAGSGNKATASLLLFFGNESKEPLQ